MRELARQWLAYADTDRKTCETLIETDVLESVVAFHAQQTIEKALKALIANSGQTPPRVHDLVRRRALTGNEDEVPVRDMNVFLRINQVAVASSVQPVP